MFSGWPVSPSSWRPSQPSIQPRAFTAPTGSSEKRPKYWTLNSPGVANSVASPVTDAISCPKPLPVTKSPAPAKEEPARKPRRVSAIDRSFELDWTTPQLYRPNRWLPHDRRADSALADEFLDDTDNGTEL